MADRYRKQSEMRNTAFLFSAMQTVTSSTNYAINQMKTAESPEDWLDISLPARVRNVSATEVHVGSCGVCTSRDDSLDGDPRPGGARTPWMDTVRRYVRRFRVSHARDRPLARDAATCSGSAYLRVTRSRYAVSLEHSNLTRIVHAPSPYPLTRKRPFPSADVRTSPTGSPARVDRKVPR